MAGRPVDADVVVVGGGPAGAAAAIACATRGLRVILCERERLGRDRPGETVHPGIEPLLKQLGVADRLAGAIGARHPGIWIEWGGPRRFEAFGGDESGSWSGFQLWRADFDALLLARAQELGVELRQPCGATGALTRDGTLEGLETTGGPIAARMVVDASGASRLLGRVLGVASPARSPRLIARYGYREGSCPAYDDAPSLVADKSGWTWTALVRPNLYQWTRVSFDGPPGSGWEPPRLKALRSYGRSRGADVTWRIADKAAGPGWFMVGDAASTLDPTSSRGVLKAIVSGLTAGHLIAAILAGRAPAATAAAAYGHWLAEWFSTDAGNLAAFYGQLMDSGEANSFADFRRRREAAPHFAN